MGITWTLDITLQRETFAQDALEIIKIVRPTWAQDQIKSKTLTGGISNQLVGYYLDGEFKKDVVIIKLYGENTEAMIDRKAEIETINLLFSIGCGPELFAVFNNGICYEFIQGTTLTMETCRSPVVYPIVAAEMAKLHGRIKDVGKDAKMWDKLETFNNLVEEVLETRPELAKRLNSFGIEVKPGFGAKAIKEMRSILETQKMPIAFCHNDVLLGNVIYNEETSKVTFIDFEYGMPNYSPFDVANHFNEFAGIDDPDFSKCPGKEFRSKWIAEYLKNLKEEGIQLDQSQFEHWVELCIPASHLFWALWAINQAAFSTIDFDYAGYFALRYSEYDKTIREVRSI